MKEFQPNNLQIIHILEYGRIYFYTNLFSPLLQKSFFRPLNSTEKNSRSWSVLDTPGTREVVVKEKSNSSLTKTFNFDRVFGTNSAQQDVYKSVVGPLIKQVLQGIDNKVLFFCLGLYSFDNLKKSCFNFFIILLVCRPYSYFNLSYRLQLHSVRLWPNRNW